MNLYGSILLSLPSLCDFLIILFALFRHPWIQRVWRRNYLDEGYALVTVFFFQISNEAFVFCTSRLCTAQHHCYSLLKMLLYKHLGPWVEDLRIEELSSCHTI
ncbi:hypothetical protein I3760_16G037300 [Carya illinoinensis]|nr:hypothetical protein I3760_16G037300 [Carya illinoinensis]